MARQKKVATEERQSVAAPTAAVVPEAVVETTAVAVREIPEIPTSMMRELITGNLAVLTPDQQAEYVVRLCQQIGLNPATAPIQFISFKGRTTLYVRKDGTEQLRKLYQVSLSIVDRQTVDGVYIVTARATMPSGRCDESTGAVFLGSLQGEDRANAVMKAETKAKRRVTLSICGLGFLDESEIEQAQAPVATPQPAALPARPAATPQPQPQQPAQLPAAPADPPPPPVQLPQLDRILELSRELKLSEEALSKGLVQRFGVGNVRDITAAQAAQVIAGMEARKQKQGAA
jgi:hypothetical protein